jgi:hypothetical protein
MRVLIVLFFFLEFSNGICQYEILSGPGNISINPSPDKVGMLLIVQEHYSKKETNDYIHTKLAYYNLDLSKIQLYVLKLKDGTCSKDDTLINFGEFKISRTTLNNFLPYKLFIPVPNAKAQLITNYLMNKLGRETYNKHFVGYKNPDKFPIHKATIDRKSKKLNDGYAIEISGSSQKLNVDELVFKILSIPNSIDDLERKVDSLSNELVLAKKIIDSIGLKPRLLLGLQLGKGFYSDDNSVKINSKIDFSTEIFTTSTTRFMHAVGFEIGSFKGSKSTIINTSYTLDGLTDKNDDRYQAIFNVTNLRAESELTFYHIGLSNKFVLKLSQYNSYRIYIKPTIGMFVISNYRSKIKGGDIEILGNYPQYGLYNMTEESLGFGKYNYTGTVFNEIVTKNTIPYFQSSIGIKRSLGKAFDDKSAEKLSVGLDISWLISQDFRKKKLNINSEQNLLEINPIESSLTKFYISNFVASINLSWQF